MTTAVRWFNRLAVGLAVLDDGLVDREISGVGRVVEEEPGYYVTSPRWVPLLNAECRIGIEIYSSAVEPGLADCIDTFCGLTRTALEAAAEGVYDYYLHVAQDLAGEIDNDPLFPRIASPEQVWGHVRLIASPTVSFHEGHWYLRLEGDCDWEIEHGLMLVFRQGQRVTRVSPYDGHPTHQHAYGSDYTVPPDALYWSPFFTPRT